MVLGVLAIEGVVAFLIGLMLIARGWPPLRQGQVFNRIGYIGLGVCLASLSYLILVSLGYRLYNLLKPWRRDED